MSFELSESNQTENRDPQPNLLAVIDIGATSVRMLIAEVYQDGDTRTLESLTQSVSLGKDSFIDGQIRQETIEDCVHVLRVYRAKLREYGIDRPEQVRVVATSAVAEANNRLAFLDRIFIATGFQVDPFDEAELHRVTFLGVLPYFDANPKLKSGQTVVCEVGGGSTELLILSDGQVVFARTYRLGALRLTKTIESYHATNAETRDLMESRIEQTVHEFVTELDTNQPVQLVVMGGEMRLAALKIAGQEPNGSLISLKIDDLAKFTDKVQSMRVDELVRKFGISIPEAESFAAALLVNLQLARGLQVDDVVVATSNLRDGLVKEMTSGRKWIGEAENQIINSTVALGKRFDFDESHAKHVSQLSMGLFQQLVELHQLGARWEIILRMAALLHEVGKSISERSYHKHSMYIIRNTVFFGVSSKDLTLVALVARYHRRAAPQPGHDSYSALNRNDRVAVTKLAAILRVAKALDASRNQRIHDVRCQVEGNELVITAPDLSLLSLEQLELRQNNAFFQNVFGLRVVLRSEKK